MLWAMLLLFRLNEGTKFIFTHGEVNSVDKLCGPWIEYDMADDWFSLLTSLWKRFLSRLCIFKPSPLECVRLPGVGRCLRV